jgi:hypothetical protein
VGPVPVPGGTVNIDLATQPSTLIATQVGSISGN